MPRAYDRQEVGTGDRGGDRTPLVERNLWIAISVHDQRWNADPGRFPEGVVPVGK